MDYPTNDIPTMIDLLVEHIDKNGAFPVSKDIMGVLKNALSLHRDVLTRNAALLEAQGCDQECINDIHQSAVSLDLIFQSASNILLKHADEIDSSNREFFINIKNIF